MYAHQTGSQEHIGPYMHMCTPIHTSTENLDKKYIFCLFSENDWLFVCIILGYVSVNGRSLALPCNLPNDITDFPSIS